MHQTYLTPLRVYTRHIWDANLQQYVWCKSPVHIAAASWHLHTSRESIWYIHDMIWYDILISHQTYLTYQFALEKIVCLVQIALVLRVTMETKPSPIPMFLIREAECSCLLSHQTYPDVSKLTHHNMWANWLPGCIKRSDDCCHPSLIQLKSKLQENRNGKVYILKDKSNRTSCMESSVDEQECRHMFQFNKSSSVVLCILEWPSARFLKIWKWVIFDSNVHERRSGVTNPNPKRASRLH